MKKDIRQDVKKRMENFEKMKKDKTPKTKPFKAKLGDYTNVWEDADGVAWGNAEAGSDCVANPSVLIGSVDSFDAKFKETQKTENPMASISLTSAIEELGKKLASKDQPEIQITPGCLKMSALANAEAVSRCDTDAFPCPRGDVPLSTTGKSLPDDSWAKTASPRKMTKLCEDIQSLFTLNKRNDIAQESMAFDPSKTEEVPNIPSKKKGRESYKEWTVPAKEDTVREVNVNKPKKTILGATADIYTSKTVEKAEEQDGSTLEPLDIPTAPLIMNYPYSSAYTECLRPCGTAVAMKDPYPKNVYTLSGKEATDFLNGDIKTQEKNINNCACNNKCEKKQEPLVPGHTNIQMELKNALKQLEYATKDSIICLLHLSDYTKVEELLKFLYTVSEMNKSYAK